MHKLIVAISISAMLTLAGCVYVVDQNLVVSQRGNKSTINIADNCSTDPLMKPIVSTLGYVGALDSNGFSLLSWNIQKGMRVGWKEDFRRLSYNKDLLIIQEAYLTDAMRGLLQENHHHWDLALAFEYKDNKTGVLTASKVEPSFLCTFRNKEPLIRIPKTILITRYPLSDGNQVVMVANVHLINYTLPVSQFRAQLKQLEKILSKHQGPLIISGDFNTWNDERMAVVDTIASSLYLKAAIFSENYRATVFGHNVDHIYYRGLEIIKALSIKITTSDHNPLIVKFRLTNEP
jgi:endonuclease/exonuclease/phosphatase (EEP) superfamily protein YafD